MNAGSAFGISIRVEHDPELRRLLGGLDVEVPADLEVVGDEADRADDDVADAGRRELVQVLEDVRAEPRLAGRRLALEGERPLVDARALGDEARRLEQLVAVRVALVEDPRRQRVRGEDDVRGDLLLEATIVRREQLDEAGVVAPALDEARASARPPTASSSCAR